MGFRVQGCVDGLMFCGSSAPLPKQRSYSMIVYRVQGVKDSEDKTLNS